MSNIERILTSMRFGHIMSDAVTDTDIVALYQDLEARDAAYRAAMGEADGDTGAAG